jgi:hypothetical protein
MDGVQPAKATFLIGALPDPSGLPRGVMRWPVTDKPRFLFDLNGCVMFNPTSVRAAGFGLAD